MAKNDFKAFATDRNANVMSQEEWEALPALISGFTAGKASSAQVNKVIRQASFIAAALAQFVSDKTQRDVLDNGDLPGFVELLGSGFAVEYLSRKNPFGDIKSDGTVQTALANLGLGDGSALPVGIPVPWPASTAPTGWLKCNGASFSADQYPKLALVYPGLLLPDLRGEFIRGWDDERGVDTGRALLSSQLDSVQNGTGSVQFRAASSVDGGVLQAARGAFVRHTNTGTYANTVSPVGGVNASCDEMSFDLSRVIRTSTETRPRNIAFNYIVRAA
ncbi:phage tail protein [Escherichia coli]|uniref:phage tail protein n=1 Tax=Escherichia coli TaxID=562 RepID=UPI00102D9C77|nr:phage tail protein [Escherichia coli]MBW8567897.1 tail fiber protein [Escherichia coli]RZV92693.1 phage tail protein [Escherichia coli]